MDSNHSLSPTSLARPVRAARAALTTACFWLAVALPVTYVPLLANGLSAGERCALLGLLAVHAAALSLGHEAYDARAGQRGADGS
jgi:hypothetical protein